MVARHSRPEAFHKVMSTLSDQQGLKVSLIDDAYYNDPTGNLTLRGVEAGEGIKVEVIDADETRFNTVQNKIVISAPGSTSFVNLFPYVIYPITEGQTTFSLPSNTLEVHTVKINGVDIIPGQWSYAPGPPRLFYNPILSGYDIELDDVILVIYKDATA